MVAGETAPLKENRGPPGRQHQRSSLLERVALSLPLDKAPRHRLRPPHDGGGAERVLEAAAKAKDLVSLLLAVDKRAEPLAVRHLEVAGLRQVAVAHDHQGAEPVGLLRYATQLRGL